jgi:uncharacterized protein
MAGDHQYVIEGDAVEEAGDYATARAAFERGAALGDAFCWTRLGLIFDKGLGCDVDKPKAMQCYQRAWRARDVVAAYNIATLYREVGNLRAMVQWFQRAAEAGDDGALVEVARCLIHGVGVRRNNSEAVSALREALRGSLSPAEREEAEEMLAGFAS